MGESRFLLSFFTAIALLGCPSSALEKNQRMADIEYRICVNELHARRGVPALTACLKAFELDPKHAENNYVLAFLYQGKQMFEKAIQHYLKAIELKPKFSDARNNLATVYIELGRYDDAVKELEAALANVLYATPYIAHGNMGWIYFKKGQPDLAIKHLKTALFTNPKFCKGLSHLGAVYESLKNYDEARRNLELSVKYCEAYGEAHYRLGLVYVRLDRRQEAKESFARCMKYAPETPFSRECEKYSKLLD